MEVGVTLTWLNGWAEGVGEGIASSKRTLLPTGERRGGRECGDCHPRPLGTRKKVTVFFFFLGFGYHWLGGQWRNRTKMKQKILHPALLRGKEWCSHHLLKSRIQRLRVARLRDAACPGASRAWQGRRRYPRCGRCEGCCCGRAGVEVEAAGGRPRR